MSITWLSSSDADLRTLQAAFPALNLDRVVEACQPRLGCNTPCGGVHLERGEPFFPTTRMVGGASNPNIATRLFNQAVEFLTNAPPEPNALQTAEQRVCVPYVIKELAFMLASYGDGVPNATLCAFIAVLHRWVPTLGFIAIRYGAGPAALYSRDDPAMYVVTALEPALPSAQG